MNYMIKGIQALKESFFLGIIIYIVIFVLLYLFKKRRTISWNYMFEGIFVIALTSNNFSFLCGLYEGDPVEQAIRKWKCG